MANKVKTFNVNLCKYPDGRITGNISGQPVVFLSDIEAIAAIGTKLDEKLNAPDVEGLNTPPANANNSNAPQTITYQLPPMQPPSETVSQPETPPEEPAPDAPQE